MAVLRFMRFPPTSRELKKRMGAATARSKLNHGVSYGILHRKQAHASVCQHEMLGVARLAKRD